MGKLITSSTSDYQPPLPGIATSLMNEFLTALEDSDLFCSVSLHRRQKSNPVLYRKLPVTDICEAGYKPGRFELPIQRYKAALRDHSTCDFRILQQPRPSRLKKSTAVHGYDGDTIVIELLIG